MEVYILIFGTEVVDRVFSTKGLAIDYIRKHHNKELRLVESTTFTTKVYFPNSEKPNYYIDKYNVISSLE